MNLDEAIVLAEELRVGPAGQQQRAALFGILTCAMLAIEDIRPPWLDDCIEDTRAALSELREKIRERHK